MFFRTVCAVSYPDRCVLLLSQGSGHQLTRCGTLFLASRTLSPPQVKDSRAVDGYGIGVGISVLPISLLSHLRRFLLGCGTLCKRPHRRDICQQRALARLAQEPESFRSTSCHGSRTHACATSARHCHRSAAQSRKPLAVYGHTFRTVCSQHAQTLHVGQCRREYDVA